MAENTSNLNDEDPGNEKPIIGPVLPPHFQKQIHDDGSFQIESNETEVEMGPALPPHMVQKKVQNENQLLEQKEHAAIGPQLPTHILTEKINTKESSYIGPQLPPHLRQELQEQGSIEEQDEEVFGPLPPGETHYSKSQIALEERALQLKMDQLESREDHTPVREEWMLELPEVKAASLGLGPRQFKTKVGPDFSDRSSWTDTPNKKAKKKEIDLKKEAEMKEIQKRDDEQERISKKLKKKNKESLLELHQSEIKKKKKEEGEKSERRPFNREIDLQVNRFDEAQKKAILKKAQLLDDRFSSGKSKFL